MFTELDAYPLPRIDDMVCKLSTYSVFNTLDLKSAYHQIPLREENKPFTALESNGRLLQPIGVTNGMPAFQRSLDLTDTFAYVDNVTIGGMTQEEHDTNLKSFLIL